MSQNAVNQNVYAKINDATLALQANNPLKAAALIAASPDPSKPEIQDLFKKLRKWVSENYHDSGKIDAVFTKIENQKLRESLLESIRQQGKEPRLEKTAYGVHVSASQDWKAGQAEKDFFPSYIKRLSGKLQSSSPAPLEFGLQDYKLTHGKIELLKLEFAKVTNRELIVSFKNGGLVAELGKAKLVTASPSKPVIISSPSGVQSKPEEESLRSSLWNGVVKIGSDRFDYLKNKAVDLGNSVAEKVGQIKEAVINSVVEYADKTKKIASEYTAKAIKIVEPYVQPSLEFIATELDELKQAASSALAFGKDTREKALAMAKNVISSGVETLSNAANTVGDFVSSTFSSGLELAKNGVTSVVHGVEWLAGMGDQKAGAKSLESLFGWKSESKDKGSETSPAQNDSYEGEVYTSDEPATFSVTHTELSLPPRPSESQPTITAKERPSAPALPEPPPVISFPERPAKEIELPKFTPFKIDSLMLAEIPPPPAPKELHNLVIPSKPVPAVMANAKRPEEVMTKVEKLTLPPVTLPSATLPPVAKTAEQKSHLASPDYSYMATSSSGYASPSTPAETIYKLILVAERAESVEKATKLFEAIIAKINGNLSASSDAASLADIQSLIGELQKCGKVDTAEILKLMANLERAKYVIAQKERKKAEEDKAKKTLGQSGERILYT